ncbi:unnamed protein product [Lactuca virosa]|uniref:Uncharacterized protein n=1 Tax=Lactuca virosa TaxID=75947 RepID=A0AAU9N9N4_9ASTR|nr:unnamed protein product [Lactuca virosa]
MLENLIPSVSRHFSQISSVSLLTLYNLWLPRLPLTTNLVMLPLPSLASADRFYLMSRRETLTLSPCHHQRPHRTPETLTLKWIHHRHQTSHSINRIEGSNTGVVETGGGGG